MLFRPRQAFASDHRKKSNRPQIETSLQIVLKIPFDRACFQRPEASINFGVGNNTVFVSPTSKCVFYVRENLCHGAIW